jgi:arginine/lysine/ornithine decarboxylase
MNKLPLLNALLEYHNENNLIFSMPGNKCGLAFKRDEIGERFEQKLGSLDITEVDPLDNLHHPEGVIREAQDLLKNYYNSRKAFFVVNGSTGANLTAIFSAFNEGDEVLVERNCHRSVYNALILRKLKVNYIEPVIINEGSLFLPPNKENIYNALDKVKSPKGIILTYPNYFGITYDISSIIKELKQRGLKVIIDQAHGAHYGVCEELPESMSSIADYVVTSAHKTLPALTQGAYLLVNDENTPVEFYLSAFTTTSPSYLIMASLDYARYYLEQYGKEDYKELIKNADKIKYEINSLNKVKIISKEDLPTNNDIDRSRYVVMLPKGYSGYKLLDYLRGEKIQGEMAFPAGVVLILSPSQGEELKRLYSVIEKLDIEILKDKQLNCPYNNIIPKKVLEPYQVLEAKEEFIEFSKSEGRIAKENIVPYPPGIPIICSGELINKQAIEAVAEFIDKGGTVLGINNQMVRVCNK